MARREESVDGGQVIRRTIDAYAALVNAPRPRIASRAALNRELVTHGNADGEGAIDLAQGKQQCFSTTTSVCPMIQRRRRWVNSSPRF